MQVVDCNVAIAGDVRMIVRKQNVTIAELVVLQAVHGREAISEIEVTGEVRAFSPRAERDRLRATYEITEHSPKIMNLFPGVTPQMPLKLEDIVLVDPEPDDQGGAPQPLEVVRFDENQRPVKGNSSRESVAPPDDDVGGLDPEDDEDPPAGVDAPEGAPPSAAAAIFD